MVRQDRYEITVAMADGAGVYVLECLSDGKSRLWK